MELVDLIRGAQDAMDRGEYASAVAACSHALETYPSCFTAHRMLAEAYLEQGRIDAAIEHFERTLTIDPLNVLARLGLGVAAEEKREMADAYASYLHAWEINPALDQVRDELVRLRGLLGSDERLHPTRSGLASIYARGGQFGRAAAEWRAVLMVEPDNRRARTSLAEVLWRSGDDAAAAAMSRDALKELPENARALAMLAEMEQRRGSSAATELIERYQAVDPLAEIAHLLSEWRDGIDVSPLRYEGASLPDFDPSVAVAEMSPVPAPAQGSGTSSLAGGRFAAPDLWDTLVRDLAAEPDAEAMASDVAPFSWPDEGESALSPAVEPFSLDALVDQQAAAPDDVPMSFTQSQRGPATDQLSLEAQIGAMAPSAETPPLAPSAAPEPAPTAAATAPGTVAPAAADPFVTADGRVDLTVGWDDLDRQLQEATPNFENAAEVDALAAQLGVAGIAPFEVGAPSYDEAAWAPFSADELTESGEAMAADPGAAPAPAAEWAPAATPPSEEPAELGWDLDEDLVAAIPAPQASGYTEMLRHVDTELPQEVDPEQEVDPFANPDSAGPPLAFEDLLAVTSRDGTVPLGPVADTEAEHPEPPQFDDLAALRELEAASAASDIASEPPLEAVPFSLDELAATQESSADQPDAGWQPAAEPTSVASELGDLGFDAALEEFGDLQPFTIEEEGGVPPVTDAGIDFSDIDEAPFDATMLLSAAAAPEPVAEAAGSDAGVADEGIVEEPAVAGWDAEQEGAEPAAETTAVGASRHETGEFGATSGVAWPAFVNHTSELIDRGSATGNLFARLREAKRAAAAAGLLSVDRSVSDLRGSGQPRSLGEKQVQVYSVPAGRTSSSPLNDAPAGTATDSDQIDVMAMRVRLIEDASAAAEIAERLEGAIQRGLTEPLALRVLGEAYLKLGRTEQAAAQFRQAMLARQRTR